MASTNNESKILELLVSMQAEIAELKAGADKPAKPAKSTKPTKYTAITVELETVKVPTLASIEKSLGAVPDGRCTGIVYPKAKHYDAGSVLSIHRCGQSATNDGRCKYHTADNAQRHANFTGLHKRMYPTWESARKTGK